MPFPSDSPDTASLVRCRHVASTVDQQISKHPDVSAVLVFGSVASGHVDSRSDVDVLVVCRSEFPSVPDRTRLLDVIGSGWLYQDRSDDNRLFADRDSDGLVSGVLVTVHYQVAEWISAVLHEVLEYGAITTERLPFRPYTLPGLLLNAWVLRDDDRLVASWRREATSFPPRLKLNLLRHFVPIFRENVEDLVANAERGLGPRVFIFRLDRAVGALVSILYALNEVYDPADRRAERTVWPTLRTVPNGFTATITEILQGPFDDSGARYRAALLNRLASEVFTMAEAHVSTGLGTQ
jgi:hypothetical protein